MYGGFLLLGGRIADLFGRRRVLMSALGVFTAGSLGCALAPGDAVLIGSRAIQVDAFHDAAIAAGYEDHGAPGERAVYYGAFVLDPDGHSNDVVNPNAG